MKGSPWFVFASIFILSIKTYGQNPSSLKFSMIPKEQFSLGTPIEDTTLQVYNCYKCSPYIGYIRNLNEYLDYFVINKDTFMIDELLVSEKMEFYRINHSNKRYLFVVSPDFSASGKTYAIYRNYYLFELSGSNVVIKLRNIVTSKLDKIAAFQKIISGSENLKNKKNK